MKWKGQTRGGLLGQRIFVFILNTFGLYPSYFILAFVAAYYFLFSNTAKFLYYYYHKILKFGAVESRLRIYINYFRFGQVLIDRTALLSGVKTNFKLIRTGGENLDLIRNMGKGGILLSAHVGNWEIAGQILNRLNSKFSVLIYENEHEQIKQYLDKIMVKRNVSIIPIKDNDLSHLVKIKEAFENNELLVMHGDRFRDGTKTIEHDLLGKPVQFPLGPFYLAAKFEVPVSIVFCMKEKADQYHLFASSPIELTGASTAGETSLGVQELLDKYVFELETVVKKYPDQWFNHYQYWN